MKIGFLEFPWIGWFWVEGTSQAPITPSYRPFIHGNHHLRPFTFFLGLSSSKSPLKKEVYFPWPTNSKTARNVPVSHQALAPRVGQHPGTVVYAGNQALNPIRRNNLRPRPPLFCPCKGFWAMFRLAIEQQIWPSGLP